MRLLKKIALVPLLLSFYVNAQWGVSPARIDMTEKRSASFTLTANADTLPSDFVVRVIDREGNEVKDVIAFPKILNQVGSTQGSAEVKLRRVSKTIEKDLFLELKGLSPHARLTFRVRIDT